MTNPVAKIGPNTIRSGASSKQTDATLDTNTNRWNRRTRVNFSTNNSIPLLLTTQAPMYVVLVLAGFQKVIMFQLDTIVLTTLIGVALFSAFPYSITLAITTIRKSSADESES